MRRLAPQRAAERERGAIAVMVALLMVVLLGSAALAVDFGRIATERGQLQNGADAAALAVADACANPATKSGCVGNAQNTATTYARTNTNDATGVAGQPAVDQTAGTATVGTTTPTGSVQMTFARILGIDTVPVNATATAKWGYPTKGQSILPLAMDVCNFNVNSSQATPVPQKLLVSGSPKDPYCSGRKSPSGQDMPGGFAWLKPDNAATCDLTVSVGAWVTVDSGVSAVQNCQFLFDSTDSRYILGKTIAVPVFDDIRYTGANAQYHIQKWAGFHILGWNIKGYGLSGANSQVGPSVWQGSQKGFYGYFIGFSADPSIFSTFTTDTNEQGNLYVVQLTK